MEDKQIELKQRIKKMEMVVRNVKNKQLLDMTMIREINDEPFKSNAEGEGKVIGRRYASVIVKSYEPYPCVRKCKTD